MSLSSRISYGQLSSAPSGAGENNRHIIFTDLDGTLIDFETYSPAVTKKRVQQLIAADIPVVFCSSKSLSEQQALMQEMEIDTHCIVENGSGLYLPPESQLLSIQSRDLPPSGKRLIPWGKDAADIQDAIGVTSESFDVDLRPYSKLAIEEIAAITGLSLEAAARAQDRDFSETLTAKLPEETWSAIDDALAPFGLQCLCGGRFYTVSSRSCNKGTAIANTIAAFQKAYGGDWKSIGLGDSANDIDMLKTVDHPYLVQRPDGAWHDMEIDNLIKIPAPGPLGWLQATNHLIA